MSVCYLWSAPPRNEVPGRNITRMENCTGFEDTAVIEDEGQFFAGLISHE